MTGTKGARPLGQDVAPTPGVTSFTGLRPVAPATPSIGKSFAEIAEELDTQNASPDHAPREDHSSSEKIELIPTDQIDDPRVRQRWHYDDRDIAKMAQALLREGNGDALKGQLQPVLVKRKADGRYEMIEGMTRLLAFRHHHLGSEIKSIVCDLADAKDSYRAGYRANEDRNPPTDYDKGMSFAASIRDGIYPSQAAIAEDLDIKKQIVSAMVAFDRLPESTHQIIEQDKSAFGYNTATRLAALFEKTGKADLVDTAATKILKGTWTYKKLNDYVNSIEEGKKPSKKRTTATKPLDGFGKLRYDPKSLLLDIDLSSYPPDTSAAIADRIEKVLAEFRHLANDGQEPDQTAAVTVDGND